MLCPCNNKFVARHKMCWQGSRANGILSKTAKSARVEEFDPSTSLILPLRTNHHANTTLVDKKFVSLPIFLIQFGLYFFFFSHSFLFSLMHRFINFVYLFLNLWSLYKFMNYFSNLMNFSQCRCTFLNFGELFFKYDELYSNPMNFSQFRWTISISVNCFSNSMNFFQIRWTFFQIWWTF